MTKQISSSPDRHSFQYESYSKRCENNGVQPNTDLVDFFQSIRNEHRNKWNDSKNCEDNLEYDLLTTDWILEKVRSSESYAQNLYAALCNTSSTKISSGKNWSCSWRYAGGIIADMRQQGDYIDWYCSGIGSVESGYGLSHKSGVGHVSESVITDEIADDLKTLGWLVTGDEDDIDS